MTVFVEKADLTYVSVPKCACSTMKRFCYEVIHGKPFQVGLDGKMVHDIYPSVTFRNVQFRIDEGKLGGDLIAVLRHPVDRIVSCFTDKIVRVQSIAKDNKAEAEARGLPVDPDFDTFVSNLDAYQDMSRMIKSHSMPLGFYFGDDPKRFARFFTMDQIDDMRDLINQRAGTSVTTGLHVNSSADVKRPVVTPATRKAIETLYAEELDVFGAFIPASKVAA